MARKISEGPSPSDIPTGPRVISDPPGAFGLGPNSGGHLADSHTAIDQARSQMDSLQSAASAAQARSQMDSMQSAAQEAQARSRVDQLQSGVQARAATDRLQSEASSLAAAPHGATNFGSGAGPAAPMVPGPSGDFHTMPLAPAPAPPAAGYSQVAGLQAVSGGAGKPLQPAPTGVRGTHGMGGPGGGLNKPGVD